MVKRSKKSNKQLRKEIAMLKKKARMKQEVLLKKHKELQEHKELEKELKELKHTKFYKKIRSLSKKKITPEQKAKLLRGGKGVVRATKLTWKTLGKVVNKLDKINI